MKINGFYIDFFSSTILCGVSISQFESRIEDTDDWLPNFRIANVLIFFTLLHKSIYMINEI